MLKYLALFIFCCLNFAFGQNVPNAATNAFHGGNTHIGVYPGESYSSIGSLKWKFKSQGKIFSSPAISGDIAYIGCADHNLYAIDIKTGKQVWKFKTGGEVNSSAAVNGSAVFFSSFDGYCYALNAKAGTLLWKFKTGGEKLVGGKAWWTMKPHDQYMNDLYDFFLSSPVFNNDARNPTVYVGSSDGNIYALNAANGKLKWAFKTNGIIHASPALYNGKLYFGSWDTYFYAVDANTGKQVWKFKTGDQPTVHLMEGIQGSAACSNGTIYFGARDGFLYALNAVTGKMAWKYSAQGSWILTTPAAQNGMVYTTTSDTFIFAAIDAKTGKQKFTFKANGYLYSSPAIAGNTAFFGDFTGKLFAVNLASGKQSGSFVTDARKANAAKLLKNDAIDYNYLSTGKDNELYVTSVNIMNQLYTLGPIVSSPVIDKGVVYFGSADGCLYALALK